jgi:sec-independent protein translocase protein TatA
MFGFGIPELVILLVIILVVFGAGKLPEVAGAMGKSILNFKRAAEGREEIEIKAVSGIESKKEAHNESDPKTKQGVVEEYL